MTAAAGHMSTRILVTGGTVTTGGEPTHAGSVNRLTAGHDQVVQVAESHGDRSIADGGAFARDGVPGTRTRYTDVRRGAGTCVHVPADEAGADAPRSPGRAAAVHPPPPARRPRPAPSCRRSPLTVRADGTSASPGAPTTTDRASSRTRPAGSSSPACRPAARPRSTATGCTGATGSAPKSTAATSSWSARGDEPCWCTAAAPTRPTGSPPSGRATTSSAARPPRPPGTGTAARGGNRRGLGAVREPSVPGAWRTAPRPSPTPVAPCTGTSGPRPSPPPRNDRRRRRVP